jgi:hypothetical protein
VRKPLPQRGRHDHWRAARRKPPGGKVRRPWAPWLLFWLTLATAAGLVALVLACPFLDQEGIPPRGWSRWVAVFARDAVLRRTALASALALGVTAAVFFRRPGGRRPLPRRAPRPPKPPPTDIAGA